MQRQNSTRAFEGGGLAGKNDSTLYILPVINGNRFQQQSLGLMSDLIIIGVCLSTVGFRSLSGGGGFFVQGGSLAGGGSHCPKRSPPPYGKERAVRILLECILDLIKAMFSSILYFATTYLRNKWL